MSKQKHKRVKVLIEIDASLLLGHERPQDVIQTVRDLVGEWWKICRYGPGGTVSELDGKRYGGGPYANGQLVELPDDDAAVPGPFTVRATWTIEDPDNMSVEAAAKALDEKYRGQKWYSAVGTGDHDGKPTVFLYVTKVVGNFRNTYEKHGFGGRPVVVRKVDPKPAVGPA